MNALGIICFRLVAPICIATAMLACSSKPAAVASSEVASRVQHWQTSFDCTDADAIWQIYACRDATLASLERQVRSAWLHSFRSSSRFGRIELSTAQRHWQRSLVAKCALNTAPVEASPLPEKQLHCLQAAFEQQKATLQAWPESQAPEKQGSVAPHALAHYVAFRPAQPLDAALCDSVEEKLNSVLKEYGSLKLDRSPDWRLIASSQSVTQARLHTGQNLTIQVHDAGPYGAYELRATGLTLDGKPLVNDRTVPAWSLELPNAGGSFSGGSSQTGDYASIDVLQQEQRVLVLVTQTWGYFASAARGESPHAALFEIDDSGFHRRCLWRTYLTPPIANSLRLFPQFKALRELLNRIAGPFPSALASRDRLDAELIGAQALWEQLNTPLIASQEVTRLRQWPLLRQRHDEALESIFLWSERSVGSKGLYRVLLPMMQPARAELIRSFGGQEGLNESAAVEAADLVLMASVAQAAERLSPPTSSRSDLMGTSYKPRFAVAPTPGDLERGRTINSLHSALLNRAPASVVNDFWLRSWGSLERVGDSSKGNGPDGDTPLMASVRTPSLLQRLIDAGANLNARNAWGKTALMTAAQADQLEAVQKLLQAGADVAARTAYWEKDGAGGPDNAEGTASGRSALHYAAEAGSAPLIEAVLDSGSDPRWTDANGANACKLLRSNSRLHVDDKVRLSERVCR